MNENHDQLLGTPEWAAYLHDEVLPAATRGVDLGDDMLEIGPGPGAATSWLRERVRRLVAVDSLLLLRRRRCGSGFRGRTSPWWPGTRPRSRYPDGSFNSVGTFTMLHHVPTRRLQDAIFAEALRVLRPGGTLVGSDSLASDRLHHFHEGDTYNPVEPPSLLARLQTLGFAEVSVTVGHTLLFWARRGGDVTSGRAAGRRCRADRVRGGGRGDAARGRRVGAGTPQAWGAVPLLAHIAEFKAQQCERIRAVLAGRIPPAFGEIDHSSSAVYSAYAARPAEDVVRDLRPATMGLLDGMRALADPDLLDPARHPWLHGRLLWLQVVVRGFWHPTGHIADYYLRHGQQERAVALQSQAVATARYLGAPDQATGMACYGLACAQAVRGDLAAAAHDARRRGQAEPGPSRQRRPGWRPRSVAGQRAAGAGAGFTGCGRQVPGCRARRPG